MRTCLATAILLHLIACWDSVAADRRRVRLVAPGVQQVGRIQRAEIRESSGLIASRQYTNVFWTHNDSGNRQSLYAIRRNGDFLAEFLVLGTVLVDWEDIATDSHGNLFIGDIGNNDDAREQLAVYQVTEPDPQGGNRTVTVSRAWHLNFPGTPFDCESLFILGTNGYVISKVFNDAPAVIYRFPLGTQKEPVVLEFVARTRIESPVTGADVSANGHLLGIVAKSGAFVYRIDGDPSRVGGARPQQTKFRHNHIEACAFVPEGLLATAESREVFLFTDPAFRSAP